MHKTKLILSLVLIISGVFLFSFFRNPTKEAPEVMLVAPPLPSPLPIVLAQVSPDGTNKVSLKTQDDKTQILVNDELIATKIIADDGELTLPFNTWSPNNKYFFLKTQKNKEFEYLVMSRGGEHELEIVDLFAKVQPDKSIIDVTGWAAPNLIIVNVLSEDQEKISFWFDIQTQKFIWLSTYFD